MVKNIYKYLLLPLKDINKHKNIDRKIYCLVDTDRNFNTSFEDRAINGIMVAKRLYNDSNSKETKLLDVVNPESAMPTEIENCLNSKTFCEALQSFNNEQVNQILQNNNNSVDYEKNSYFCFDLRESEKEILKNFFNENNGYRKIEFAKKYIEIAKNEERHQEPKFITEIKNWFNRR